MIKKEGTIIWLAITTLALAALQWFQPTLVTGVLGMAGATLLILSLCEPKPKAKKPTRKPGRKPKPAIKPPLLPKTPGKRRRDLNTD
jgi:hypothetical protein